MDFETDTSQIAIGERVKGRVDAGGADVHITRTGENEVLVERVESFYSTLDRVAGFYPADVRSQVDCPRHTRGGGPCYCGRLQEEIDEQEAFEQATAKYKDQCNCGAEDMESGPWHSELCPEYVPF